MAADSSDVTLPAMHSKIASIQERHKPAGVPELEGFEVWYYPRLSKRLGERVWALVDTETSEDARIQVKAPGGDPPGWFELFDPTPAGEHWFHPSTRSYSQSKPRLNDSASSGAVPEAGSAEKLAGGAIETAIVTPGGVEAGASLAVASKSWPEFDAGKMGSGMATALNELVRLPRVQRPPASKPSSRRYSHGWFYKSHQSVLDQLLSPDTKLIVELGSWLGSSTKRLLAGAPNAVVIAVDFWSNRFVLEQQGDHYVKDPLQARMLERLSLLDTFVANTWSFGDRLILMRMSTPRAMRLIRDALLQAEGSSAAAAAAVSASTTRPRLQPDLVYVDADHHHAAAKRDIEAALAFFPDAHIVGDDWDYSGVRRAATELAAAYGRRVHAQDGKCWTYSQCKPPSSAAQDLHADALGGTLGDIADSETLSNAKPSVEFAADAARTGSVVAWADVVSGKCPGARGWSAQGKLSAGEPPAALALVDDNDDDDDHHEDAAQQDDDATGGVVIVAAAAADDDDDHATGGVVIAAAADDDDDDTTGGDEGSRAKRERDDGSKVHQPVDRAEPVDPRSSAKRAKPESATTGAPADSITIAAEATAESAKEPTSALSFRLTSLDRLEQLAYPSRPAKASVVAWIGSASSGSSGVRRVKEVALPPVLQAAVDAVRVDDAAGLSAALAKPSWHPRMLSTVVSKAKLPILHFAARAAAVECVRALVDAGADVNRALAKSRMTPLHEACYTGSTGVARLLLELGANPNARSKWGETPAQAAGKGLDVAGECESLVMAAAAAVAASSSAGSSARRSPARRYQEGAADSSYDASRGGYTRMPRNTTKSSADDAGYHRTGRGRRGDDDASSAAARVEQDEVRGRGSHQSTRHGDEEKEGAGRAEHEARRSRRSVSPASSSVSEDLFADSGRTRDEKKHQKKRGDSRSKSRRSGSRHAKHSDESSDDDGGGSRRRHRRHRDEDRSGESGGRRRSSSSRHHRHHRHRSTSRSQKDEDGEDAGRSSSRHHHRSHRSKDGRRRHKDRRSRSPRSDASRSRSR